MQPVSRIRVWAALFGLLGACSSGGAEDDGAPSAEVTLAEGKLRYCRSECERFAECSIGDASICTEGCVSNWNPIGLRGEALLEIAKCAKSMPCERFAEEAPAAECFAAASATVPLTEGILDYCETMSKKEFSCAHWWEVADCVGQVGLWSDDVLLDVQSTCASVACEDLEGCYDDTYGKYQ
jgi:hypothetical protein